jgi:hypothetical protein
MALSRNDDTPAYDTYDVVVRDICAYLGDPDANKKYVEVARFLRRALNTVNLHLVGHIKSIPLEIGENLTTPLPDDFNHVTKIGVCCEGQIRVLPQNEKLCIPEDIDSFICCTCPASEHILGNGCKTDHNQGCGHCRFHNITNTSTFQFPGWVSPFMTYPYWYGHHGKNYNGSYRIDHTNGQVVFGSGCDVCAGKIVIMEYNAALGDAEYQLIPRRYFDVLLHKTASYIKRGNEHLLEKREFEQEYIRLKRSETETTLEELVQALQAGLSSAPRR